MSTHQTRAPIRPVLMRFVAMSGVAIAIVGVRGPSESYTVGLVRVGITSTPTPAVTIVSLKYAAEGARTVRICGHTNARNEAENQHASGYAAVRPKDPCTPNDDQVAQEVLLCVSEGHEHEDKTLTLIRSATERTEVKTCR